MINITNKEDCCGCQVCGDICGKHAISFQADEEGIWYPVVDKEKCVDCGLCDKVCPIVNHTSCLDNSSQPVCYVLQAPKAYDRLQSASGAAYTLLARAVFAQGGIIAGHIWDEEFGVRGLVTGNPDDLELLRGTKYLQSNVEGLYLTVRKFLKEGKMVLFSGTPCQNAALQSFLAKKSDNLIMTDFVCMGIDSPWAFKKYIESLEHKYNSQIVYFKAKSKEVGWRHLTNKAVFKNGKSYFGVNGRDANLIATFLNVLVRPSCYNCRFKGFPRVSDITIGDYWRKKYDYDPLDDNTGTSYIMLHNDKAEHFFEQIKNDCAYHKVDFNTIIAANGKAIESLPKPFFNRSDFYSRLKNEDFAKLVDEYSALKQKRLPLIRRMKGKIRLILNTLSYYKDRPLAILPFIYYNFISRKVITDFFSGNYLLLKNTNLILKGNSQLRVKGKCIIDSKNDSSCIIIGSNAVVSLDSTIVKSGCLITAESNTSINIGFKSILGNKVKLYTQNSIDIGEFSLIDDHCILDDTNQNIIYFNAVNKIDKSIIIGTHVLVNRGSIIKQGTTVGDECIIKEYSVVDGTYASNNMLAGNPATIVDNNIKWKYNF